MRTVFSSTLVTILYIDSKGRVSNNELIKFLEENIDDNPVYVYRRIYFMKVNGLIRKVGDYYELTDKGKSIANLYKDILRRILCSGGDGAEGDGTEEND